MTFRRILVALVLLGLALLGWSYGTAVSDPALRRAEVRLPGWPAGEAPVRAVLISDVHVAGPDMPPSRLARIVGQINALDPDLVLIAGDLVSDKRLATRHYSFREAAAPLRDLRARDGVFVVLGNHDHWRDAAAARAALAEAGISELRNQAVRAGPIALGGIDDFYTRNADVAGTVHQMRALGAPMVLVSHSPDPFARLPGDVGLMLAGHTHCGQIAPPLIGPLMTASNHGRRYACGIIRERGRLLIVTAGLGTSMLPLRLGARPDLWLITLGPAERAPR